MSELRCNAESIEAESILRIVFAGDYAPASEGNPVANRMKEYVTKIVAERHPRAILFDLSGLNYRWGDAIGSIAIALVEAGWKPPLNSVCVFATHETAEALYALFQPNSVFGFLSVRLFEQEQVALAYLKEQHK